jgi:hypothetical protein
VHSVSWNALFIMGGYWLLSSYIFMVGSVPLIIRNVLKDMKLGLWAMEHHHISVRPTVDAHSISTSSTSTLCAFQPYGVFYTKFRGEEGEARIGSSRSSRC